MPFDFSPTETKPIDRLIEALRGPEPKDWNFAFCNRCALDVAFRQLGAPRVPYPWDGLARDRMAEFLGMPHRDMSAILMPDDGPYHKVRPRHVAAALEHYRDTGEALSPFEFVKRERS